MNHKHFQELVQSIQNSYLLSEIPYIDLIGFGNPTAESLSGEIPSIFSSENHLTIIIIAYTVGDLRMLITCRFDTIAELEDRIFALQADAFFGLEHVNYSIIYEKPLPEINP